MALVIATGVLTLLVFFHVQVRTGFKRLSGGVFDGTIEIAILEHWWNVVRGLASWRQTNYFYPASDTLAYNDGYLIYGLIYSAFRAIKLDPYLSAEAVNAVIKAAGFVGFQAFAQQALRLPFAWGLLGAVLFTLNCGSYAQANHAQLLSVAIAPVTGWLLARMLQSMAGRDRWCVFGWGAGAALLYAAWLLTAYYMAWFFAFFLAAVALFGAMRLRQPTAVAAWRSLLFHRVPFAAVALVGLVGVTPFLTLYLPKAAETGMHPFNDVVAHLPSLADLVHVGQFNLLFGWLDSRLHDLMPTEFAIAGEHIAGLAPGLLALAACGTWYAWVWGQPVRDELMRAVTVATVATWALAVSVAGCSAWFLVYNFVPGAKAIRIVVRYQIFLAFPAVAIGVWFLAHVRRRIATPMLVLLAGLLIAEEITTDGSIAIDRPSELRHLAALRPASAECRAFFTAGRIERTGEAAFAGTQPYIHNVDAMLISELIGLPTVNGFSTFNPPGWDFAEPDSPDYLARVGRFVTRNGIEGLCGLDLRSMRWFAIASPALIPLGQTLGTGRGQPGLDWLGSGWSAPEAWGTWSDGTVATLRLGATGRDATSLRLTVSARGFFAPTETVQRVDVLVGGQQAATWRMGREDADFTAILPPAGTPDVPLVVQFRIARPASPFYVDGGRDTRRLGIGLTRFQLDAVGER